MEEWNATLPLQLLLAVTATGAENQTHCFVIISNGSRFPISTLCVSPIAVSFLPAALPLFRFSFDDLIFFWYNFALWSLFYGLFFPLSLSSLWSIWAMLFVCVLMCVHVQAYVHQLLQRAPHPEPSISTTDLCKCFLLGVWQQCSMYSVYRAHVFHTHIPVLVCQSLQSGKTIWNNDKHFSLCVIFCLSVWNH